LFQKKENRIEFSEGYNNLIKLEDEINKFEHEISQSGDYGKRYAQIRQDMSSIPLKRRKIQILLEEVEENAGKILEQARSASQTMVNVLEGFLGKDSRGKYYALTNLSKIAGKNNQFIASMDEVVQQFRMVLKLLDNIEAMESGR